MDTVFVKPAEGARIRQPERNSRVMPAIGDRVLRNGYYERLIITGDVVVTDPPQDVPLASLDPQPAAAPDYSAVVPSKKD